MHTNRYKFTKKINKCDVTSKSTITKRSFSKKKKKVVETIKKKKSTKRETKLEKERDYWPFCCGQLGRNRRERERGGNEVQQNLY